MTNRLSSFLVLVYIIVGAFGEVGEVLIHNGEKAAENQFPHVVSLFRPPNDHFCGGSLVSQDRVLTAAHCLWDNSSLMHYTDFLVKYGNNAISDATPVAITGFTPHPLYDNTTGKYDLALLHLETSILESGTVRYADVINDGQAAYFHHHSRYAVAGWGETEVTEDSPNPLQDNMRYFVLSSLPPNGTCEASYPNYNATVQLCAGDKRHSSCFGDSGGPLMFVQSPSAKRWIIAGVVGYGKETCGVDYQVYARLSNPVIRTYLDERVTWPSASTQPDLPLDFFFKPDSSSVPVLGIGLLMMLFGLFW